MSQAVLTAPALRAASPSHPLRRITRLTDRLGPLGTTAAITLTVIVLAAAAAPLIAPFDPNEPDLLNVLSNPTTTHWFGTDALGRDIFRKRVAGRRFQMCSVRLLQGGLRPPLWRRNRTLAANDGGLRPPRSRE